jgi:hypothetical protein
MLSIIFHIDFAKVCFQLRVIDCVVVVIFQIIFYAEIYVNDIFFYFLKIIFNISTSKQFKIYKTY